MEKLAEKLDDEFSQNKLRIAIELSQIQFFPKMVQASMQWIKQKGPFII